MWVHQNRLILNLNIDICALIVAKPGIAPISNNQHLSRLTFFLAISNYYRKKGEDREKYKKYLTINVLLTYAQ